MERTFNWAGFLVVMYLIAAVASTGPAIAQSERGRSAKVAACVAKATCAEMKPQCEFVDPAWLVGLLKAAGWPLWLSYTIALTAESK